MKIYLIRLNLRFSDILVISFLRFILASLLLIITFGCSFDTKTGIWKNINEQKSANIKLIKLSDSKEKIQTELNLIKKFKNIKSLSILIFQSLNELIVKTAKEMIINNIEHISIRYNLKSIDYEISTQLLILF